MTRDLRLVVAGKGWKVLVCRQRFSVPLLLIVLIVSCSCFHAPNIFCFNRLVGKTCLMFVSCRLVVSPKDKLFTHIFSLIAIKNDKIEDSERREID